MFRSFCLTTAMGLAPGVVFAQCAVPTTCAPRCDVACPVERDVAAPAKDQPAPGNFLRGPATGQASGESRSFGIRGPALHIPEMRIALPTLEFPSPVKFRRNAEMIFDQVRGPHSLAAVQEFGNLPDTTAPAGPDTPAPPGPDTPAPPVIPPPPKCTPYYPPPCDPNIYGSTNDRMEATLARLEKLEAELTVLRAAAAEREHRSPASSEAPQGALKPYSSAGVTKGSRPVPVKPVRTAPDPIDGAMVVASRPQPVRGGLSAPASRMPVNDKDEFGAWSRAKTR